MKGRSARRNKCRLRCSTLLDHSLENVHEHRRAYLTSASYRHSVMVDGRHELATDLPIGLGGQGSAPEPHDYFDVALATCKALTVTHYARQNGIPLTGISVEVSHDAVARRRVSTR